MKIEITEYYPEGRPVYYWTLYDGPDGIDKVTGYAVSLEEALTKILQWRHKIAHDYIENDSDSVGTGTLDGPEHCDPGCGDDGDPEQGS